VTFKTHVQNAAGVFKEDKDLAGLMAATASVYESSAYVAGAAGKVAADPRRIINISDQWARVEVSAADLHAQASSGATDSLDSYDY